MTPTLEIYDDIAPAWVGGIDAATVAKRLAEIGPVPELTIRINSRGGDAFEAIAMHNLLAEHPAVKTAVVMGVAASAATLPLMAANRIHVPKNGLVMVHHPSVTASGREADLENALARLRAVTASAKSIYASRTRLSESEVDRLMTAETWMSGEDAVRLGFADSVDAPVSVPSLAAAPAMSGLPIQFSRAPSEYAGLLAMSAVLKGGPALGLVHPGLAPLAPILDMGPEAREAAEAERSRIADLTAVCRMAGRPELAQDWIDRGVSLQSAQNALRVALCADRVPVGESGDGKSHSGANAKYAREYAEGIETYKAAGISPEAYARSRRIDDGLESLLN